jgi:hypothetical protein
VCRPWRLRTSSATQNWRIAGWEINDWIRDVQGTSREHSGNIQGTFRERSVNIQRNKVLTCTYPPL